MLYYTVPSIVKKDFKSPGLYYVWHLQIKLIFYTKNKERKPQNQEKNTHKQQENNWAKADYWSKKFKLELFNS